MARTSNETLSAMSGLLAVWASNYPEAAAEREEIRAAFWRGETVYRRDEAWCGAHPDASDELTGILEHCDPDLFPARKVNEFAHVAA